MVMYTLTGCKSAGTDKNQLVKSIAEAEQYVVLVIAYAPCINKVSKWYEPIHERNQTCR